MPSPFIAYPVLGLNPHCARNCPPAHGKLPSRLRLVEQRASHDTPLRALRERERISTKTQRYFFFHRSNHSTGWFGYYPGTEPSQAGRAASVCTCEHDGGAHQCVYDMPERSRINCDMRHKGFPRSLNKRSVLKKKNRHYCADVIHKSELARTYIDK